MKSRHLLSASAIAIGMVTPAFGVCVNPLLPPCCPTPCPVVDIQKLTELGSLNDDLDQTKGNLNTANTNWGNVFTSLGYSVQSPQTLTSQMPSGWSSTWQGLTGGSNGTVYETINTGLGTGTPATLNSSTSPVRTTMVPLIEANNVGAAAFVPPAPNPPTVQTATTLHSAHVRNAQIAALDTDANGALAATAFPLLADKAVNEPPGGPYITSMNWTPVESDGGDGSTAPPTSDTGSAPPPNTVISSGGNPSSTGPNNPNSTSNSPAGPSGGTAPASATQTTPPPVTLTNVVNACNLLGTIADLAQTAQQLQKSISGTQNLQTQQSAAASALNATLSPYTANPSQMVITINGLIANSGIVWGNPQRAVLTGTLTTAIVKGLSLSDPKAQAAVATAINTYITNAQYLQYAVGATAGTIATLQSIQAQQQALTNQYPNLSMAAVLGEIGQLPAAQQAAFATPGACTTYIFPSQFGLTVGISL